MMKHLYVAFAALLLILLTSTAGFAQRNAKSKDIVTRTIIGCTLGETTIDQIEKKIHAQNGSIKIRDGQEGPRSKTIDVNGVKFWGKIRNKVILKTIDGVLYLVSFLIYDKEEADELKASLSSKYITWKDNSDIPLKPYRGLAVGISASVFITYEYSDEYNQNFKRVVLTYIDNALCSKALKIRDSDL